MRESPSAQRFREECLADRGYKFLIRDIDDMLWEFRGLKSRHVVRVKPDGSTEDVAEMCVAPWTSDKVAALEKRQADSHKHPYTCICGEYLVPTMMGWVCSKCTYTQNWAHWVDVIDRTV